MKELQLHEQMALYGRLALSDKQLLECIGLPTQAAEQLLQAYGNNLGEIAKLNSEDIQRIDGIGATKASALVAAMEIGRRRQTQDATIGKKQILQSYDSRDYFHPILRDETQEQFWIMLLDRRSYVITVECIHIGGMSAMVVDPKIIFQKALQHKACSIILCHNHPSGRSEPSTEDIRLTEKIKQCGSFLDIKVLDHIVIGDGQYYSFADEGKM